MADRASAERWDAECAKCAYRNGFIVPTLREFIVRHAPATVLDVGAASGYIARRVASARATTKWTLLDADEGRIELAKELCTGNFAFTVGSVFDTPLERFDVVLLSNTLLEFELADDKLTKLISLISPTGWIVAILPDTSADVVNEARKGNDVFDAYARGNLHLSKQDKFTQTPYPFVAHRLIDVVCALVEKGLNLRQATRNSADGAVFLAFQNDERTG